MATPWTFPSLFAQQVRAQPERTLAVGKGQTWTYREIDRQAAALAVALSELGVVSGDRVAVHLPNCAEWLIVLAACARLGATVVPISPRLNVHELRYQLRHADATIAVTIETWHGADVLEQFEAVLPDLPALQYIVAVGAEDRWYDDRVFQFDALLARGAQQRDVARSAAATEATASHAPSSSVPTVRVHETDDLAVIYTAGAEGKPKGVRLGHRALLANAAAAGELLALTADDRVHTPVPFSTVFGFSVLLGTIVAGATLVLEDEFDPASTLALMEQDAVTVLHAVPTMWHMLMREPSFAPSRVRSVRTGVIAGSAVAESLVARVRGWCDVLVAYGLTETGPTITMTRRTDSEDRRNATVGCPLPGVDVKAVDLVTGGLHGPEAVGELAVRSPYLMQGYLRMPEETARVHTPEGYFLTGDLGIIDEDGCVRILGRRREAITRGGFQVYPRDVEDRLRAHPAVDDVCVIGVPHEALGEQVCACIVPVEGAVLTGRDITLYARDVLAHYKVPDLVRFYDALPLSGSGTVRRRELARALALELSASHS